MSVSQVQNNKWPVVSLKNGTGGAKKEIQAALEWLEGFETVVLMFDMDEPGRKAVEEVAPLFTPGKVKIARLPLKDASDMLVAGRGSEIVDAIWGAKAYRPDGILTGSDLWERIEKKAPPGAPLPWLALSGLTLGVRPGEVITLTAGSGIGKSSLVREVIFHHHSQGEAVGLIALEESVERSALALMGLHLNKRLHLGIEDIPAAEKREAFEATVGSGRMFFYDHFGSTALDNLLSRIRYMAKGCGCKFIALDHLSIVVSGMAEGDERRMIDNAMTALKSLAMECQVVLYLVVHLRRTNDDSTHEEGGQVRASHLRGSHSILQLSDTVIAAERNQQDEKLKNITQLRLLKARWTGASGVAGWLEYDENSGRLVELFEDPFRSKSKLKDNEDGSMVESPF
jgi:twinkle protein